jgi:hypothetical protein
MSFATVVANTTARPALTMRDTPYGFSDKLREAVFPADKRDCTQSCHERENTGD